MSSTQQTLKMIKVLAKVVKANSNGKATHSYDTTLEANIKIRQLIKTLDK